MHSRLIAQPDTGSTLRVRIVRNASGAPVVELSELVRSEPDGEALEVVEGGRVHLAPAALQEAFAAAHAACAEVHAEAARAAKVPRLKRVPPQPAPSRPTRPRYSASEGEF